MIRRLACAVYWPALLVAAAIAMTVAAIPFTGRLAGVVSVAAAAVVLIAGHAYERKDHR